MLATPVGIDKHVDDLRGENFEKKRKRTLESDCEGLNTQSREGDSGDVLEMCRRARADHDGPPNIESPSSSNRATVMSKTPGTFSNLHSLCVASEMLEESYPSPTSEASSGRKRRIPPGPGLKWCAGGSGGGGRWVDARDEIAFGTENFDRIPTPRKPRLEDPSATIPAFQGSKPSTIRPKHRVIGNGIFISGGRVMMNDSASEEKVTICTFCGRSFVSAHALDVHLSRNQVLILNICENVLQSEILLQTCRNEKDKAQTQSFGSTSFVGRGPSARPLSPILERCRGIVQSLMKRPEASPFNDSFDTNVRLCSLESFRAII